MLVRLGDALVQFGSFPSCCFNSFRNSSIGFNGAGREARVGIVRTGEERDEPGIWGSTNMRWIRIVQLRVYRCRCIAFLC